MKLKSPEKTTHNPPRALPLNEIGRCGGGRAVPAFPPSKVESGTARFSSFELVGAAMERALEKVKPCS